MISLVGNVRYTSIDADHFIVIIPPDVGARCFYLLVAVYQRILKSLLELGDLTYAQFCIITIRLSPLNIYAEMPESGSRIGFVMSMCRQKLADMSKTKPSLPWTPTPRTSKAPR